MITESRTSNQNICVIVPTHNEGEVIRKVVEGILSFNFTVVVVDDGSNDDTVSKVQGLPIHYLRHQLNLGQGAALKTGLSYGLTLSCQFFVTFDGDGQHHPADILPAVNFMQAQELDIVFGSRFMEITPVNLSVTRKFILKLARWINFVYTGILLTDAHNGFRVLNRLANTSIDIQENRMAHASEIMLETKIKRLQFDEFAIQIIYSEYSKQKGQSAWSGITILCDIFLRKIFS